MNNIKLEEYTKIIIKKIPYGNITLYLKQPLIIPIYSYFDKEIDSTVYKVNIEELNIYSYGFDISELITDLQTDLFFTWQIFALRGCIKYKDKLDGNATKLKCKIRNSVDYWKVGNMCYNKYPNKPSRLPKNFNYNIKLTQKYFEKRGEMK